MECKDALELLQSIPDLKMNVHLQVSEEQALAVSSLVASLGFAAFIQSGVAGIEVVVSSKLPSHT